MPCTSFSDWALTMTNSTRCMQEMNINKLVVFWFGWMWLCSSSSHKNIWFHSARKQKLAFDAANFPFQISLINLYQSNFSLSSSYSYIISLNTLRIFGDWKTYKHNNIDYRQLEILIKSKTFFVIMETILDEATSNFECL